MARFGKRSTGDLPPEQVRGELFAALERGDRRAAGALVRRHMPVVLEHFRSWQTVPEPMRGDAAFVQRWGSCLMAIVELAAEQGQFGPRQSFLSPPEPHVDPVVAMMRDARARLSSFDYAAAIEVLDHVFAALEEGPTPKAEETRMFAEGWLGECYFQLGHAEEAVPHLERALRLCERRRDIEGTVAQLGNLYEANRYLGDTDAAAQHGEQLAARYEGMGRRSEAQRMYQRAVIVRYGEPANRVVAIVNGDEYEIENAPLVDGRTSLVYTRNRITLAPAVRAVEQASALGSAGNHAAALDLFEEAAAADVHDPNARYLQGFTLMHLERPDEAVEALEAAEAIAPGWHHCRADLWLARQVAAKDLPHAAFLAIHALEDGPITPHHGVDVGRSALGRFPELAPLHLELGRRLVVIGDRDEADRVFREGVERAAEPDVRSRLLIEVAKLSADRDEQAALYDRATDPDGNLVAAAIATMALRRIRG